MCVKYKEDKDIRKTLLTSVVNDAEAELIKKARNTYKLSIREFILLGIKTTEESKGGL